MSNKYILSIVVLICFSYTTLSAQKRNEKTAQNDRKIRVILYPFESDLPEAYNTYIKLKIKTSLYNSKKYELVEKDEKKLADDINYAKKKWNCKDTASTVQILATISEFEYKFDVAILVEIKGKLASLKVIKSHNSELLLIYSESIVQFSDLSAFFKKIATQLVDDIKNKYIKPDIFLEWEFSIAAAATINTGALRALYKNGIGTYAELRAYGVYRNMFLKTAIGFFHFNGVNYSSDTAYFFPIDIAGCGYTLKPGNSSFSISPSLGLGIIIMYSQTGTFTDISKRGILKDENSDQVLLVPQSVINFKFEYQWHNFKAFAGISFNLYIQKNAVFNQIIPSLGILYLF